VVLDEYDIVWSKSGRNEDGMDLAWARDAGGLVLEHAGQDAFLPFYILLMEHLRDYAPALPDLAAYAGTTWADERTFVSITEKGGRPPPARSSEMSIN
jgi:hypothetical protein